MALQTDSISALLQLEHGFRRAESSTELHYVLCNQLRQLIDFDVAILLRMNEADRLKIEAVSDHASIERTAPFVTWFEHMAQKELLSEALGVQVIETQSWSEADLKELAEFTPDQLLWVPLIHPATNQSLGGLILAREEVWNDKSRSLAGHIASTASHAMQALDRQSFLKSFKSFVMKNRLIRYVILTIIALMFIPVRLSVIAPAEIVAKAPFLVTAGINGAIKSIDVMPGEVVSKNTPLVRFDDTQLVSEYEIARKSQLRAEAELLTTQRGGFVDVREKSKINELKANVELRKSEVEYAQKQLDKAVLVADQSGVVVLNDPHAWVGRPVSIGEKIMSIADPLRIEIKIMLPVQDSIVLKQDEPIRLFLDSDPLNSLDLSFVYATYLPEKTPQEVLANKVIADLDATQDRAGLRIGMRGTAKLYGDRVSLFYYLFRRPITFVRQWVGW
ncbi:MAG: HlyD family efflux transporter periplasmic adaptor subunit [Oceanospirillales bacterium]|nr:HlyD family efflux transporter periplasmic adaptor subunit [Oceanospirillales bacterium]MBR9887138.1 HlyD family efflux transporter periplasmic adaptor subunit [Oceanospirillales bacterium]